MCRQCMAVDGSTGSPGAAAPKATETSTAHESSETGKRMRVSLPQRSPPSKNALDTRVQQVLLNSQMCYKNHMTAAARTRATAQLSRRERQIMDALYRLGRATAA